MGLWEMEIAEQYVKTGLFYGYPTCCIDDFVKRMFAKEQPTAEQERAGAYTGFLPCPTHAKQVLEKKVALKDLIRYRKCETPFDG
jgi:hypothetical protein